MAPSLTPRGIASGLVAATSVGEVSLAFEKTLTCRLRVAPA